MKKLSDLSNVKAGDTIWTIQNGYKKVKKVIRDSAYPIKTSLHSYTLEGKIFFSDKNPIAFIKNPFENIGFEEREMEVSDNKIIWYKKTVFGYNPKLEYPFLAYNNTNDSNKFYDWKFAREIEPIKEYTLEELEEMVGHNFKIK